MNLFLFRIRFLHDTTMDTCIINGIINVSSYEVTLYISKHICIYLTYVL